MNPTNSIKNHILPVISGASALLVFLDSSSYDNIPKIIVATLGLVASILYFTKKPIATKAIITWIIALFPVIVWTEDLGIVEGLNMVRTKEIWDVSPINLFNLSLTMGFEEGSLSLGISLFPVIFIFLFRIINANAIIGNRVTLEKFRTDNNLGIVFPLNGIIDSSLILEAENFWYSVKLDSPLDYDGKKYSSILIRNKEEKVFKLNQKKVSYLRLVENLESLKNESLNKDDFPFVDWVYVTLQK